MHTINSSFDSSLNRLLEDCPVPPDLNNPPNLVLDIGCSSLVSDSSCLSNDGGECQGKVILVASLGLLDHLCKYQGQLGHPMSHI